MDNRNDSGSREVKPLNAKYNPKLWMTLMTLGREFRVMDDMKDLGSREPKLLDAMNSSGLRII